MSTDDHALVMLPSMMEPSSPETVLCSSSRYSLCTAVIQYQSDPPEGFAARLKTRTRCRASFYSCRLD